MHRRHVHCPSDLQAAIAEKIPRGGGHSGTLEDNSPSWGQQENTPAQGAAPATVAPKSAPKEKQLGDSAKANPPEPLLERSRADVGRKATILELREPVVDLSLSLPPPKNTVKA